MLRHKTGRKFRQINKEVGDILLSLLQKASLLKGAMHSGRCAEHSSCKRDALWQKARKNKNIEILHSVFIIYFDNIYLCSLASLACGAAII